MRKRVMEALRQSDDHNRELRARRIEWLSKNQLPMPPHMGRLETLALHREAAACYREGHLIATLVTAAAFVEHSVFEELMERGLLSKRKARKTTMSEALDLAKKENVFPNKLIASAKSLYQRRNAYMHFLLVTDKRSFGARFLKVKVHPDKIRDADARSAIRTMDAIFHATLRPMVF
jgi:hypothetical protein